MSRRLLVDLGNTRLKWAWLSPAGRVGRMQAAAHAGWTNKDFAAAMQHLQPGDRVFAVSVAAPAVQRRFAAAVRLRSGRGPQWLRSSRTAAGVHNAYREPWRLGADRWAALLAARRAETAVLIADVGTAVTLDLLDGEGRHLGGAILPGAELMVSALLRGTGGIRRRAAGDRANARDFFGRSTRAAVEGGARLALVASLEAAVAAATRRLGHAPALWLTGGGAGPLRKRLPVAHEWHPALVLDGLARGMRHGATESLATKNTPKNPPKKSKNQE